MSSPRPRYSDQAFPAYSYVPRFTPHPISDPAGHMVGMQHATPPPLQPDSFKDSPQYLYAVDLFNHGYYWEAHEAWESLWHAAGRQGQEADFLKGLIKLAAAGVKAREGNPRGVKRHSCRAKELLEGVSQQLRSGGDYCGLKLHQTIALAASLEESAARQFVKPQPDLLLGRWLRIEKLK